MGPLVLNGLIYLALNLSSLEQSMTNFPTPATSVPSRAARFMLYPLTRIVLGILAVAVPVVLTLWLAHVTLDKSLRVMWPQLLAAFLCVTSYRFYVRRVEKRAVTELSRIGAAREVVVGALGISALLASTMCTLYLSGTYQVTGTNRWTVLLVPIAELALVACVEELAFRGVIFRIIESSLGSWIALALTATLFALSHLPNEGVTALAIAVTGMAGVMLSAAFMATRRLWLAIGIHFGWNFTLSAVFSVAVSGHPGNGLLQGTLVGSDWLTGGAYGIEASVVGLALVTIASALLIVLAQKRGHVVSPRWKRNVEQPAMNRDAL